MKMKRLNILFPLLFLSPLIYRAIWSDIHIYQDTAALLFGAIQVLAHDAPIFFAMALLLYISFLPCINRFSTLAIRLAAAATYSIYLVDLFLLTNFNTRLAVGDIFKYASYAWKYIGQLFPYLLLLFVGLALFVVLAARFAWTRHKIARRQIHWHYGAVLALLLVLPVLRSNDTYVHGWRYQNVVAYNLTVLSEARPYGREFAETIAVEDKSICSTHDPRRKNIILLMVESLSAYQSQLFSGINNWTPQLDAIAEQNLYFTHFLANGFTTEDGEIALLSGRLPIYGPASFTNWGGTRFRGFFQLPDALPQVLKRHGYNSEYITSADLAFAETGIWAESIGFDHIEGHAHPFYDAWPRYQFEAAPDEALYQRVLVRVNQNRNHQHFFMFIKTAGTHHPFIDPENDRRSERAAFSNADRQLGRFYQRLVETGFFDSGMLIITGDHRAMVPLGRQEIERFGALEAAARVPLVVVSKQPAARIDMPFQQTDVFNSLKNMVSTAPCTSDWLGDLLNQRIPPRYIGLRRGDRRDTVTVITQQKAVQIKLAGDGTRIVRHGGLDATQNEKIVNKINQIRILGDQNQRRFNTGRTAKPPRRFSYHE